MLKEKKNFLKNIMFISIILLMIMEVVDRFWYIGYFPEIKRVLSIITIPIIIMILGNFIRHKSDEDYLVEKMFKRGFVIYFVLQIINMLIFAIARYENPGYFLFSPYLIDWIFIAIPIYTLIMQKLGKESHILFTTTVIALCLTIDGSINSSLICNLIMYLPFFVLGWKYEEETKLIPKGKLITLLKIAIVSFIVLGFYAIIDENVYFETVKTTENTVQIMTLKLMLYASSAIVFSTILDLFSNIKIFNKDYKFNFVQVLLIAPIINNILQYVDLSSIINSTYSIAVIAIFEIILCLTIGFIPFNKIIDFIYLKLTDRKEKKKNKKIEKLKKKGKFEERLIFQPDGYLTKLVNSNLLIILIGVCTLLKLVMFYLNTVYKGANIPQHIVFYNVSFILILLIPLLLINNSKIRYIALLIWDAIISVILFADELYFSYSSMVISVNQVGNIRYIKEILNTMKYLLDIRQILYFVDIIVLLILLKLVKFKNFKKGSRDRVFKNIIVSLLILYMCVGNIVSLCIFVYYAPYSNSYQISEGTIFGYHLNDLGTFLNVKGSLKYKTKDELREAYRGLVNYYDENYTEKYKGIAKNKNIIVLQLESIQEFLYKAKIGGKEITPNLNKFLDENIHITNMHSQSYTSTADSEFAVQMSMYPLENGLSFSKYFNVEYEDLFTLMTNNNYYTSYMHGNDGSFWNRDKVYSKFNINEINFIDSFEDTSEKVMYYLSDELLYKQAVPKMEKYQSPFFVNMLSASSHTGFTLDGLDEAKKQKILTIDVRRI